MTIVAGDHAHVSVIGALRMLGFGAAEVVRVPVDDQGRVRLDAFERTLAELLQQSDNIALQGDLVAKSGFSKVKVSRLLDHLEARGLVERRRRGMSNLVLLKPRL